MQPSGQPQGYGQPPPGQAPPQYGQAPPGQYGQPPPGQYGQPPPGQYSQPPPGQYGQPPPGQYGQPPPGQHGQPPAGQYAQPPPGQYSQPPPAQAPPQQQQQQYPQPGGGLDPQITAWFYAIDVDKSGHLDAKELQKSLALGNLNFNIPDVDQMIRAFDKDGNRTLGLQEFCSLHQFLTSVMTSFKYYDQDRSGTLQSNEVTQALRQAGFTMEEQAFKAVFKRFDPDGTSALSLDEFIRMSLFMQSCVRTFGAFDSQRSGRITLDFNQFLYAVSHT